MGNDRVTDQQDVVSSPGIYPLWSPGRRSATFQGCATLHEPPPRLAAACAARCRRPVARRLLLGAGIATALVVLPDRNATAAVDIEARAGEVGAAGLSCLPAGWGRGGWHTWTRGEDGVGRCSPAGLGLLVCRARAHRAGLSSSAQESSSLPVAIEEVAAASVVRFIVLQCWQQPQPQPTFCLVRTPISPSYRARPPTPLTHTPARGPCRLRTAMTSGASASPRTSTACCAGRQRSGPGPGAA